jgi:hypothetical protein
MQEIGNERANKILEHGMAESDRLTGTIDQQAREAFIKRKYMQCDFVQMTPTVDMDKAIMDGDIPVIFQGVCQCRKSGLWVDRWLHMAAAGGNPTIALLVGLNSRSINWVDEGGWSALSYAAFHGHFEVAEALISIGCDPNASPNAHPYVITSGGMNQNLRRLFLPYWNGPEVVTQTSEPPKQYEVGQRRPERIDGMSHTLAIIGMARTAHV